MSVGIVADPNPADSDASFQGEVGEAPPRLQPARAAKLKRVGTIEPSHLDVTGQGSKSSSSTSSNIDNDSDSGDESDIQSQSDEASKDSSASISSAIEGSSECSTSHSEVRHPPVPLRPRRSYCHTIECASQSTTLPLVPAAIHVDADSSSHPQLKLLSEGDSPPTILMLH